MYQRVPWAGDFTALASKGHTSTVLSETSIPQLNALPEDHSAVQTELLNAETPNSTTSVSSDHSGPLCAILESYPHDITDANENEPEDSQKEQRDSEYSDPFAALGMTTSDAARVLRDQAGRGMEISKQAFADLGKLSVNAKLDDLVITLFTAEGAIACFDVSDCRTDLVQYANGAVEASGEVSGFGIRDLISAFDAYSETIRYSRRNTLSPERNAQTPDGWSLKVPNSNHYDIWLEARLRNIRIVYLHRFVVILKKYFDVLRESLRPVREMKGGIAEDVDIVMPRHSQSPYEALRFVVSKSSITKGDLPTPGYRVGFEFKAEGVDAHILYQPPAEGEGRALTEGGTEPTLKQITPDCPITDILPFSRGITIVAKLDTWRRRRVPEVILNAEGIPVLKDGQEEREYDPGKWLPTIRVRVSPPNGVSARLCEAEYSILYFTFTENIIERPDIEFTDIVRGLKTPILPTRKPVQPIMFSSNRMPPNYKVLFEVHLVEGVIMSGADGQDELSKLIRSELCDLVGYFEYGVDYRMTIDVSANMHSLQDARPFSKTHGMTLIIPTKEPTGMVSPHGENSLGSDSTSDMARSVTLTWDRPFGFRANVMVVASDLRIIVEPELFRDLGSLTTPGFPFLKSSAPPPLLRFNGRLLIVTISRPEMWLMANQYPGDGRALVIRGDVIAKVMWAAVTGRNTVEVAAHGVQINVSSHGPSAKKLLNSSTSTQPSTPSASTSIDRRESETPMLYSCDVSVKFEGRGYDPPKNPGDKPRKAPGSTLSVNAESFLVRIDVNDASLILAVGSRLV
ncbi:hypothetical protein BWQ96_00528 [Gracilariopsis chorda]|uniref:Uncharacterized protein n=1 Tax=Gracilariopsis chorda TaxID=448386 RepID=A0A2V3JA78_9FLOR|nr:hypothetical protein BWQ96_00528 [Gracilariopsis chorda]|eukprot:PXF49650.1 hypothetical protein BWQ96_00528 [Gracilariopsis chorda]